MTAPLHVILIILAFVCFILAAWMPAAPWWNRIVALGLAAFVASMIWSGR